MYRSPRSLRAALVIAVAFATLFSYLVSLALDESGVQGASYVVSASGESTVPARSVVAGIETIAREQNASIGKVEADLADPRSRRILYLATGSASAPAADWLSSGYPGLSQGVTTVVRPLRELAEALPRGEYVIFGDPVTRDRLVGEFRAAGMAVLSQPYYDPVSLAKWLLNQPLGLSLVIVALLLVVVGVAGALLGARGYGIQRMQGASFQTMVARDVVSVGWLVLATVTAGAATLTAILLTAGAAARSLWLPFVLYGGTAVVLWASALVAHVAGVAITGRFSVLSLVKGRSVGTGEVVVAWIGRVVVAAMAIGAFAAASGAAERAAHQQQAVEQWADARGATYVTLRSGLGADDDQRLTAAAGRWLRQVERDGRLILSFHTPVDDARRDGPSLLIVNKGYLDRQRVELADGQRLGLVDARSITLAVPSTWDEQSSERAVRSWLEPWWGRTHTAPLPAIVVVRQRENSMVFNYAPPVRVGTRPARIEAAILVLPSELGLLSDDDYVAFASQGGAVIDGKDHALQTARQQGVQDLILGFRDAAQDAANNMDKAAAESRLAATNLVALLAALVVVAAGTARVYVGRWSDPLYVKHLTGWPVMRMHMALLVAESVLVGLSVLVIVLGQLSATASATALVIVAGHSAIFGGSVAQRVARLVRTRAAQE